MKKNVMMRVASIMLVLVLMSSSVISGTFAKYVTQGSSTDSARVAKWGVGVVVNGETFANAYVRDDNTLDAVAQSRVGTNSVVSGDSVDVVAPGTKGDLAGVTLAGIPEVATKVTYVGQFDIENWVDQNGKFYCPLVITIKYTDESGNPKTTALNGLWYDSAEQFEADVNNYINAYSKYYAAGTNLAEQGAENLDITWEWPFSTSADNDVRDTHLGDQAAVNNAATVQLTLTCTVTQVD